MIAVRLKRRVWGDIDTWPDEEVNEWLAFFELEREANEAALEAAKAGLNK